MFSFDKYQEVVGSNMNFGNFIDAQPAEANVGRFCGTNPLSRQQSVYSLTFDEFQSTWGGGLGKDFGSINMDELLKSIWSAEETQAMTSNGAGAGASEGASSGPGNLQKQGSLTLPRTISQKTVDEVWKDLFNENEGLGDGIGAAAVSDLPQRQRTLGEMTLEEFLVRAGVAREEMQAQQIGGSSVGGFYGGLPRISDNVDNNNASLAPKFQQQSQSNSLVGAAQSPNFGLNVPEVRYIQPQQLPLFPKPTSVPFVSPVNLTSNSQLASTPAKGIGGIHDPPGRNSLLQVSGVRNGGISVAVPIGKASPATSQLSPEVSKNTLDSSSGSPVPYPYRRGRKPNGVLEKAVERRQRRMIKNRESAARSRARKQAYTLELEAEISKLKKVNQQLQKKQDDFVEAQKNQILETYNGNWGSKRLCLRRTLTGPW